MKKITLLLLLLLVSVGGYSQLYNQTEGFEGSPSPAGPLPAIWTLNTGNWAIFERNIPVTVGSGESWGINAFATGLQYEGSECASVSREQIGLGGISEDYLATSQVDVPATGITELHFWTRNFVSGNQGTIFKVMIAPAIDPSFQTDPAAYTDLAQWSELDLIVPTSNFNVWTEKTVTLPDFTQGQSIYIAFVKIYTQPTADLDGDRWLIDKVGVNTQCTPPVPGTTTLITSSNATLNWANPGGATSWEIEVVLAADAFTGAVSYTHSGPPPFTIPSGDLQSNTTYKYRIRGVCSSGFTSDWSVASANFTTLVAPPICGGNLIDSGGIAGNYANNENVTTTVTPAAGEVVTVTFTAFNTQANTDILRIHDGPDATFPVIATLSGTALPPSFTSTAPNGELTFVFTSNGTTVAAGYAANITCGPAPACRIPNTLTASGITTTTVTLDWLQPINPDTSVATVWDIIALPCGSAAPTASSVPNFNGNDTTAPPFTLTGLTPATCYDIYVRAVCGTSNSGWNTVPARVNMLVAPPICGGNFVDTGGTAGNYGNNENLTTVICPDTVGDAVTITFTAFNIAAGDTLAVYDGDNSTATLLATLTGTTLPPSFVSSAPSGCLTFVFTSNGTGAAAGWLANVTCAPQPGCAAPTVFTTGAVLHNSVSLNWVQPANPDTSVSTTWNVYAVPCGSAAPTASSTPTQTFNAPPAPPYSLTGLTPLTCYDIYVRAVCGSEGSIIVGPRTITTLAAPPECGGNFVDAGGTTGSYAASSDVTTVICPQTPGDVVTVTFTAFNTEATFDALYVFDGNSIAAPQIASANGPGTVPGGLAGGYWGAVIPGPFTSSAANGCLTFRFRSDTSVQNPGWLANVTCAPPPTCRRPTAITTSVVTSNSVTLNWTQPANPDTTVASAWEVLALPCGSPIPTATSTGFVPANTNVNFVLNTGLSSATCYDIYIRAVCSATDSSSWAGPATITTQVAPPVCGGNFVDNGGATANYTASANVTTTICPTTPGDVVTVTFTSFNTEATFDALYVYDGNSITAPQIASANGPGNVPGAVAGGYWGTVIPGPFTSSSVDGCLTFVFRSDTSVQNPGFIANVTCAPPPTCRRPTAIATSLITHNSVTLNWNQPINPDNSTASSWQVLALPCGSPLPGANPTTGILVTANTNTNFLLTGLSPTTCYDIYIRAVCSDTDSSAWGGPASITTLVAPPVCGGQFVDAGGAGANYANNSNITTIICPTNPGEIVTVTFTSFNTEATWDGLYVYDGNAVVPANQIASTNPAGNVPGGLAGSWWGNLAGANLPGPFTSTTPDGCLTFVFRSDGTANNPGWVANVTCAAAPTCARPVLLTAFPVTQTTATLNWTQLNNPDGSTATNWEVLVLPAGSPIPIGGGIPVAGPASTYFAAGLTPGTAYVFYVRAICDGTNGESTWSALNFATKPVNDECDAATFAIVNQNLNCVQTTPGTLAGATGSAPPTTCGGAGAANDDVWFTFTATTITHVISFNNVVPANADLSYAIYQGTCNGLTEVGCNTGAGLTAGTTYYLRVFSDSLQPQFTDFDLCIGTLPCTEAPAFCTGQTVTYANSTNVPSLGQIGCLFTSPNPAFFFLQVNQAGPLSYLISQVDNGGIGRDVDYVAWGPFTDLNSACTGVPANPLGQTVPIPTPTTGCPGTLHACSYSTAPQEIMCIPNAQLCEVYVIMITNFSNQAGTVTFTQTNSGGGTTACFPINTFNYAQTYYCQNQPNPTPVLAPGASAGVYSSTPGLVIDPVTGTIDLLASIPGNYIVTSTSATTIGGTCNTIPFITTTRTVIITAPANATIAYPAATYCNSITATEPVTLTGTIGGTYSATPAGLLLNVNTGEIIPVASAPGLYTVTYTIPATGGCAPFTTTTQIEILASPVLTQNSVTVCDTFTLPTLTEGGYFTSAGGVGPIDPSIPIIATQTIFIYAEGANGCITERQFTVTINRVPTPIETQVTQSSCTASTGSIRVTNPFSAGGALPNDLFISEVTDADTGSLTYVELYNATGAPVNLANYKLKFYTWGAPPTSENLQCDLQLAGTIPNNATNVIKVSNNANIAGVTPNQTFASCAGVNNNDNIRLTTVSGTEIDVFGRIDGSIYSPAGQTGFTYRRLNTSTIPSPTWVSADWTAIDPEDYTNIGIYAMTVSTYQYALDGGTFTSDPLFTNLAPGPHTVVVRDTTTGCLSAPVTVVVDAQNAIPSVTTFTYTTPVCQNATVNPLPDTSAAGFTTGGVFTSSPSTGIDLNPVTGEINLAATTGGSYDITYTIAFDPVTCQSFSSTTFTVVITDVIVPVVGFSYTTPICQNAQATLSPTLNAGFTTGGIFSSTTGLVINPATGVIDLAASTAGPYTITYTVAGDSCQNASVATFDIIINPVITPVTTFTYTTPICQTATVNPLPDTSAAGFTTGGVFTSNPATGIDINPSTGEINLAGSIGGTYDITYTVAADLSTCQVFSSTTFTVVITNVIIPVTGFSYTTPICQDAQATLIPTLDAGFTTGGTFSSTTGLTIDSSTGVIDVTSSTAGPYTITYALAGTSCLAATVATFNIVINPVITPVTSFTYTTPVCLNASANPTPTFGAGFTNGGIFTSNPASGIDLNASTGEINLVGSTDGTYVITYAVAANPASCQVASSTDFTIVLSPVVTPIVGFNYTTPICKNAQATLTPILDAGFTLGGTFSSTTGLSINASSGVIDLANSTAGTYTITYDVLANATTCQVANSATFNIVINPIVTPVTNFSYASPFCYSVTSSIELPTLGAGFTSGGTFSSTSGLIINATTGAIDLISTPGTYTITYTVNADPSICQVTSTGTAQITIVPPVLVELNGGCQNVYVLNVSPVNGSFNPETATFLWENELGVDVGSTQSINLTAAGTYTVTVTFNGCSTTSDPFVVASVACQIQKGISVNNDGFNDTFDLTGFDVKKLTIFNRYGTQVYSRANYVNEWGGKSDDGDELPDGTYFYVLDKNTGDSVTGWIYINRAQ